jgi:ATP-dependent DNA helicase RecG
VLRFPDDSSVDYDRREQVDGPLHHVLEETVRRVARELGTELVVLGTRRYELSRLPDVVLREAIANALAHRSYEAAGTAVRVELRPSAVVVRSPGGLPEPVTVENIRETTAARNLVVIRVLRALGLAEDVGRGVDVMQDTMAAEMRPPSAPGSTNSNDGAHFAGSIASRSCMPHAARRSPTNVFAS